jgi:DNA-binding response OmpR family regulator
MTESKHILVVDDEPELQQAVQEYLCLRGFRVSVASNGKEMRAVLATDPASLVLLDLSMPGENGIELTRQLKSSSNIGVIIVTAHGESEDRVLGLETGADDYIVKPFNFRELLARVNSVLRRIDGNKDQSTSDPEAKSVEFGGWTFEFATETLSKADGETADLSAGELDLLIILLENANNPVSRDDLLKISSHREWGPFDRSIDVKIARLRNKIEVDPSKPKIIKTVRSIGYVLNTSSPSSNG